MKVSVSAVVQPRKHPPYRTIDGALTLVRVPGPCSTASYEMFQMEHDVFWGYVPQPHTKCSKWNTDVFEVTDIGPRGQSKRRAHGERLYAIGVRLPCYPGLPRARGGTWCLRAGSLSDRGTPPRARGDA